MSRRPLIFCSAPLLTAALGVMDARAAERGLSNANTEASEMRSTCEGWAEENAKLQSRAKLAEERLDTLQKNLALANTETEVFKRQAQELKKRLEAVGLDRTGGNSARLEQRLLEAVSDLKLVDDERKRLQGALIRLSEAIVHFQRVAMTTDAEASESLESEMRHAAKVLGVVPLETKEVVAAPATLQDGIIISIKEDLGLVVANVGARHGVKVGMPFQVIRSDASLGTVRVVDVRERIAGAVIEASVSAAGKIQSGDRLKVVAQQ